jgi:hypothetical protein
LRIEVSINVVDSSASYIDLLANPSDPATPRPINSIEEGSGITAQ